MTRYNNIRKFKEPQQNPRTLPERLRIGHAGSLYIPHSTRKHHQWPRQQLTDFMACSSFYSSMRRIRNKLTELGVTTDQNKIMVVALAIQHPLYRLHNLCHHQLQHKLLIGIPSPSCNSTKMEVIHESKFSSISKTPSIQNFITVRKERCQSHFSRRHESPETLSEPHLEELTITAKLGNTELSITNVYIPPASSCT